MDSFKQRVGLYDPIYDEISNKIRETYKNVCVLWVDKINNEKLTNKYEMRKKEIKEKRGDVKELKLFHGTSEKCAESIIINGFDVSKNIKSAYGKGTYFSTSASMSQTYSKSSNDKCSFIFLSKVLIGNCCDGNTDRKINTNIYDNFVNNSISPSIYVTPYNDGALPLYLISFYKGY